MKYDYKKMISVSTKKEGVRSGEGFKIIITNSQLVTPIPFIYIAHPTNKPPCPGTDVWPSRSECVFPRDLQCSPWSPKSAGSFHTHRGTINFLGGIGRLMYSGATILDMKHRTSIFELFPSSSILQSIYKEFVSPYNKTCFACIVLHPRLFENSIFVFEQIVHNILLH